MLEELRVENLLLIERAALRLEPGLNVITGETGAGKTVLAHALDLLLGGKARSGIVRPGASEAYVEGIFSLTDGTRALLGDRLPADAEELVLARRVWSEGRTRAYLNGRSCPASDLREIGSALLSFSGQHESRRLTLASVQLEILDGFCGEAQSRRRGAYAAAWDSARVLRGRAAELRERMGARERELDLLEWELGEIEAADPRLDEEDALEAERSRLRHVEKLRGGAAEAVGALLGDDESGAGAVLALAEAVRSLDPAAGVDPELDGLAERLRALSLEADDLAAELRRYGESVDAAPGRLDAVEERLGTLERLKRKHGGTLANVLAYADACRQRRDELTGADEALDAVSAELAAAEGRLRELAAELRAAREHAGRALSSAVRERLDALAMPGAAFEVVVSPRSSAQDTLAALGAGGSGPSGSPEDLGPTGGDDVEFLIAPNPGVAAAPLREIASGGELSRVLLALMSVAASVEGAKTLVLDEVDAGIGGQTARAVGEELRSLAAARQVLCITHLPQIAALADRHFRIEKNTSSADTARTTVTELDSPSVVAELVRMLGADADDRAAQRHAKELLRAA